MVARAPSQRSLRLWMGLAFAAVAAALGAVNVILALSLLPEVRRAQNLSGNQARSVELLAAMRGRLSEMRASIAIAHARTAWQSQRTAAAGSRVSWALGSIRELRGEIDPLLAGQPEASLWAAIADERLPVVIRAAEGALEQLRRSPQEDDAIVSFLIEAEEADRAIERLEDIKARQATRAAAQIGTALRKFTLGAALLAVLGIGAALGMFVIAHVALQRWAVTVEERANELEAFASRVAHDLRTPLQTVLLAFASIGRIAPEAQPACDKGRRSVERLQELIDDLLEFSRAGAAPEEGASASLETVLEDLREELEPGARAAGGSLRITAEPGLAVAASRGALRAIAGNLVENALKHGAGIGAPEVEVEARREDASVRLEVRDRGPGISPEALAHVFEPFYRATRAPGGFGIGLATVRRLVDAHGGEVRVASSPGHGTTFVVLLPVP
ncbi:sensor histidine kinase [Anaeromyxobacter oryzisoli]|uniref:sensor histidine kinase n=1 Tax=Anaeromyxobacter oryzisoli TaxID=2925408 RepID=UPI001F58ADF2|nr:HAMP domain-containing sensor histidine kinase [Anaeromyxobacter sp. SG63]